MSRPRRLQTFFYPNGKERNVPLINGTCVPMACYTRRLIQTNAKLLQVITRSDSKKSTEVDLTNNAAYAALLQQGLNTLRGASDLKCDGCVCHGTRFNPPLRIPTSVVVNQSQDTDPVGGVVTTYTYTVTAEYDWQTLGNCYPPGSPVKVGEKWVPVEKAAYNEYRPGSGEGSGGNEKKKGKVKPKPVRRVKKIAKAKKPPRRG
jgi:hypothetical protein